MLLARLSLEQGPRYGVYDNSRYAILADDPMFGKLDLTGQFVDSDDARILTPMIPRSKIVGFDGVYSTDSVDKLDVYIKPNTAVIGGDEAITMPQAVDKLVCHAQLAAIISRPCRDLTPLAAPSVVFGYTLALDFSAPTLGAVRGRVFDTSCVLGPHIDTEADPSHMLIKTTCGDTVAEYDTGDMRVGVAEIIAHASQLFTLLPGDIVLLGAPESARIDVHAPAVLQSDAGNIGHLVAPVVALN